MCQVCGKHPVTHGGESQGRKREWCDWCDPLDADDVAILLAVIGDPVPVGAVVDER